MGRILRDKLSDHSGQRVEQNKENRHKKLPKRFDSYELSKDKDSGELTLSPKEKGHRVTRLSERQAPAISFFKKQSKSGVKKSRVKAGFAMSFLETQQTIADLGITDLTTANYISSKKDKPALVVVKPLNLLRKTKAFGLFAKETIEPGTCIGEYTGDKFTKTDFEKHLLSHNEANPYYAMTVGSSIVDARVSGNFTRYINFSDSQANVQFQASTHYGTKIATVVATKRIVAGQQFLVDYNIHDPLASESYYFLNPQDNWQSTAEFFEEHKDHYTLIKSPITQAMFNLKQGNNLYVTDVGNAILTNQDITDRTHTFDMQVNLPYIKLNRQQRILDATETDLFTPIMLASYLGQVKNVKWLISHGASVDQQQNHSGHCALFLALEGYRQSGFMRANHMEIIRVLIKNNANLSVHDREDNTFLHKAISVLSPADFNVLMSLLPASSRELFSYIDKNDHDILVSCIKNRYIDQANTLMSFYPGYMREVFTQGDDYERQLNKRKFSEAIQYCSAEEKYLFITHIESLGVHLNEALKLELNLVDDALLLDTVLIYPY